MRSSECQLSWLRSTVMTKKPSMEVIPSLMVVLQNNFNIQKSKCSTGIAHPSLFPYLVSSPLLSTHLLSAATFSCSSSSAKLSPKLKKQKGNALSWTGIWRSWYCLLFCYDLFCCCLDWDWDSLLQLWDQQNFLGASVTLKIKQKEQPKLELKLIQNWGKSLSSTNPNVCVLTQSCAN